MRVVKVGRGIVRYEGQDYPIQALRVLIHVIDTELAVKCTSYEMASSEGESKLVHHLAAEGGSWKFNWVIPDGTKSKQIAMKLGDLVPPKSARLNPRQKAEGRKQKAKADKKRGKKP